jgi:hypothetical protein
MSLADRQALLARFLDDENLEMRIREHPDTVAAELDVPSDFVRWLAQLPVERVVSFRRSRQHKDALRSGNKPSVLDD